MSVEPAAAQRLRQRAARGDRPGRRSRGRKHIATPSSPAPRSPAPRRARSAAKRACGIWVSTPAPSPVRASAPTPPRWVRLTSPAEGALDDLARGAAGDVDDETDAAGVVLVGRARRAARSIGRGCCIVLPSRLVPRLVSASAAVRNHGSRRRRPVRRHPARGADARWIVDAGRRLQTGVRATFVDSIGMGGAIERPRRRQRHRSRPGQVVASVMYRVYA